MDEAAFRLTSLLDSLPQCENKLYTMEEINLVLSSIPSSMLKCVVSNLSFGGLFECLTLDDRQEQLETWCSLLSKLLDAVDATVLLSNFQQELLCGLAYENESVCNLCLQQVSRFTSCEGSDDHLALYFDVFQAVIRLITISRLSTSKLASKIVIDLGKTGKGLQFLLARADVVSCFGDVMKAGDVERYRVYECLIELSVNSSDGLRHVNESGFMHRFLAELDSDDILCYLNCLDLLTTLAITVHGSHYLHEQGILEKLNDKIGDNANPLEELLLPGMLKLFGSLCLAQPSSTFSRYRKFVKCLFHLVNGPTNKSITLIAIETVGFIGITPEGKLTLNREDEMKALCTRLGVLTADAPLEVRVRALHTINNLMELPVGHPEFHELLSLTEVWFSGLSRSIDESFAKLLSITRQPFLELHVASLELIATLIRLAWCQSRLIKYAGFLEYLLDRSTERGDRVGLETKYNIVVVLASCETAVNMLSGEQLEQLREYVKEGPFYVKYESHVAFDNAD